MSVGDSIRKNLTFWHWYPRLLCEGLTEEQLHWQPDAHSNHITFAVWHTYRAADEIIHGMLARQPSVFAREGWAERLPVEKTGESAFGNGLSRQEIADVRLPLATLLDYAETVGAAIIDYTDSLTEEQAAEEIPMPFFAGVYPIVESMSKIEAINFFAAGHTAEHLGEVRYIKGLLGLKGAPL